MHSLCVLRLCLIVTPLTLIGPSLFAQPVHSLEPRAKAATCLSSTGSLLTRGDPLQPWKVRKTQSDIYSRDLLLTLPASQAEIESISKGVRLILWGNTPDLTPYPVLESAVVLHDTRAFDLDFTLDRGRVILVNARKKGEARIWVRLPNTAWELTLNDPDSKVALEMYGRWPNGLPFNNNPRNQAAPTQALTLIVLKGSVSFKTEDKEHLLKASGPATIHWDSVFGRVSEPSRLTQFPSWATEKFEKEPEVAQRRIFLRFLQSKFQSEGIKKTLQTTLDNPKTAAENRQLAVYALGAIDSLSGVMQALTNKSSPKLRETAVETLRHWIGHSRGQDMELYRWIVGQKAYTVTQADTIMQLLHSPFNPADPVTYQALIAFLQHKKLAVRELARWHLARLAPEGKEIQFDAAAAEQERAKAVDQWRKLIPSGKLPSSPKKKK